MNSRKQNSLVSIIMPIYNGEKCCEKAIQSVLNQTYKNIELIVINDGSKDRTFELVNKLAQEDNRLHFISQSNSGVSVARNRGLKESVGDYVVFIDSDDSMNAEFIERMLYLIERDNSDIAICGYRKVYSDGRTIPVDLYEGKDKNDTLETIVGSNNINYLWNKMYRKRFISHSFNIEKWMGEDLEFNCMYFLNVNSISITQDLLYNYTVDSEESLTKNEKLRWNAISDDWICLNYLQSVGVKEEIINEKMLNNIFYIIQQQGSKALVVKKLDDIFADKNLCKLVIDSRYSNLKYKVIRLLIKWHAGNLLFYSSKMKRQLKRVGTSNMIKQHNNKVKK